MDYMMQEKEDDFLGINSIPEEITEMPYDNGEPELEKENELDEFPSDAVDNKVEEEDELTTEDLDDETNS